METITYKKEIPLGAEEKVDQAVNIAIERFLSAQKLVVPEEKVKEFQVAVNEVQVANKLPEKFDIKEVKPVELMPEAPREIIKPK